MPKGFDAHDGADWDFERGAGDAAAGWDGAGAGWDAARAARPSSDLRSDSGWGDAGAGWDGARSVRSDLGSGSGSGSAYTASGQRRADRAAQFMPFAALTGYYELARAQERVVEPKHELTEEEALALSRTMAQVKRGDMVRVTYYDWDCYRTISGMVAHIDPVYRRLQVIKTIIAFDDIRSLQRGSA